MDERSKRSFRTTDNEGTGSGDGLLALLGRLIVGGAVEGTSLVGSRLRRLATMEAPADEVPRSDPGPVARVGYALVGMVLDGYGLARHATGAATRTATAAGRLWGGAFSLVAGPVLRPLQAPYAAVRERGFPELDRWVYRGEAQVRLGRRVARGLVTEPIDDIVRYLERSPELEKLVRRHAAALLAELLEDAELRRLVRAQGDDYVEYLRRNPERIQELLEQHSAGLARQVADAVRARAVTADDLLERQVRAILLRRPVDRPAPGPPASEHLPGSTVDD